MEYHQTYDPYHETRKVSPRIACHGGSHSGVAMTVEMMEAIKNALSQIIWKDSTGSRKTSQENVASLYSYRQQMQGIGTPEETFLLAYLSRLSSKGNS
jgi:hypothetical protein